jgi:hypothetical protein
MTVEKINEIIEAEYNELKEFAMEKNISYNGSIFNPDWIIQPSFDLTNKQMIEMGLVARINDKLNRIKSAGLNGFDEDNIKDLIGYLVLYRCMNRLE